MQKSKRQIYLEKELKKEKARIKRQCNKSQKQLQKERLLEIERLNNWMQDKAKEFRKDLVTRQTKAESILARALLKYNDEFNFSYQNIIYIKKKSLIKKFYIVDFFITSKKLIIELDGEYHYTMDQQAKDLERTKDLEALGYKVLRFDNYDVIKDPTCKGVINTIRAL